MKAVRYHSYGDSGVLVYEEADRPVAGAGQVVVKVAGAAFNPVDVAIRAGFMQQVFPVAFPHIPNFDVAGVIAEVGEGVSGWSAGDRWWRSCRWPRRRGRRVRRRARRGAGRRPRAVELADAAALPSAGLTAWQSLFEHAGLKEGQSILVNGAGGAVGGYAVQLARQAGATVTATGSARSADRIRSYGADRIIDYTATPLLQAVAGQRFDAVLNLVRTSPEETAGLADLAADGGAFVSTTTPDLDRRRGAGCGRCRCSRAATPPSSPTWSRRVDAGELQIDVAARRPLTELADVHDEAVAGRWQARPS